jgi:hypothetical protein
MNNQESSKSPQLVGSLFAFVYRLWNNLIGFWYLHTKWLIGLIFLPRCTLFWKWRTEDVIDLRSPELGQQVSFIWLFCSSSLSNSLCLGSESHTLLFILLSTLSLSLDLLKILIPCLFLETVVRNKFRFPSVIKILITLYVLLWCLFVGVFSIEVFNLRMNAEWVKVTCKNLLCKDSDIGYLWFDWLNYNLVLSGCGEHFDSLIGCRFCLDG